MKSIQAVPLFDRLAGARTGWLMDDSPLRHLLSGLDATEELSGLLSLGSSPSFLLKIKLN